MDGKCSSPSWYTVSVALPLFAAFAAYERVADLPPRRCFCIDGKGQFCDSCWLDDPTLQHPTAGTAKNIPVEDQEIYRAKITRAVGTCELEESEKYDIDCVVKKKLPKQKEKEQ